MKTLLLLLVTFFSISSYSQVDRRIGQGQYKRHYKQKNIEEINDEKIEIQIIILFTSSILLMV